MYLEPKSSLGPVESSQGDEEALVTSQVIGWEEAQGGGRKRQGARGRPAAA